MTINESKLRRIEAGKLVGLGIRKAKVADDLGVTRACIHIWDNDPDFVKAKNDAADAYEIFKNFYLRGISAAR